MEYKILEYDIRNYGRMCDAIGIIFGIGVTRRLYIMDLFGFGRNAKAYFVNYYMKDCLRIFISHYTYVLGSRLQNMIKTNIFFYVNIWLYRGVRFRNGLPMRGQSTRSNAKTIKYTVNFFNLKKF